ncbi:NUDIX hydrolase [Endozoicomonas arenosclerae]|uniref:NUDIX hydrolase n=1 Tax=Endozoicomonas arenosclerae TaxID=1633495 RepID=UPI00078536EC|nr:NUDIX domain-containing protein [Endozoicomonas arenosclerae]
MDETSAQAPIDHDLLLLRKIKVCPVVIRENEGTSEILVFKHPLAGIQLAKGTLEKGETLPQAALRELQEESGIANARIVQYLGAWKAGFQSQQWHFILCNANNLKDSWHHYCEDDGGHNFRFFWHSLENKPDGQWHSVYSSALKHLKNQLPF